MGSGRRRDRSRRTRWCDPSAGLIEAAWLAEGAAISSINLGEVLYIRVRSVGADAATADVEAIRKRLKVMDADWQSVSAAALIKSRGGLSYADAFAVATAVRLDAPLWTGDPEIVDQASEHSCETVDLRD